MAEQEKLPNKERRALAREERKRKAEQEAKAARKRKTITGLSTLLVGALIIAVVVTAFTGRGGTLEPIVLDAASVEAAQGAAGCETISDEPLVEREHFEPTAAPPADTLYTGPRPTHSGSHYNQTFPIVSRGADNQIEERALTHNLEHGSIAVWYDPEQVDGSAIDAMEDWSESLNDNGFTVTRGGTAIFVSPYTDPGISSGKAIAIRAWGLAIDCDTWDEEAANGIVTDRFGSHGIAPEGSFAPFPEDVMSYADGEPVDDETAPSDGEPTEPASEPATDPGTETETEPVPSETTE